MHPGDLPADGLGEVAIHPIGTLAQHRRLVETAHLQHIVHGVRSIGGGQSEAERSRDHGVQRAIDVGRCDAVQAQLLLSGPQALGQGGEVQKPEIHGLLPLQGAVGIEIDLGDRRLDPPVAGTGLPRPGGEPLVEIVALHPFRPPVPPVPDLS